MILAVVVRSLVMQPLLIIAVLLMAAANGVLAAQEPADVVVQHGFVVTMNQSKDVFEDGAVVVRDGRIVAIGPNSIAARYWAAKKIDADGDIVMPGMINAHTHVSMSVFRGLGDDVPDRLTRFIFPLEHKLVDRDIVYWGGLWGMIEMVQGGVTTMADMYYFEDEVARGARKIGMRGVLGETLWTRPRQIRRNRTAGLRTR